MNILEFFTPAVIAAHWSEVHSNAIPYLGQGLFPSAKKAGLDLAWLKGSKGLPVSLMPSAFDTKATFRDRPGFSKTETEMPFFREGFLIKEKDRQDLLRVSEAKDPYAQAIIARVFDDASNLIEGARVVPERMRMALLFAEDGNVRIVFKANGVAYEYNYDPDGTWKANNYTALTGDALWTAAATADPFRDIKAVKDGISDATGTTVTTMLMNSYTFNLLGAMATVKARFLTVNGMTLGYLTDEDVVRVIKSTTGMDIAVYDKKYKDESGQTHAFVPNGYVAFVPAGTLGNTWYGTTPEEADLMGSGKAEVSIIDTGVALTRVIKEHPVNVETFASEIVLPSYERMDEVGLLKVIA